MQQQHSTSTLRGFWSLYRCKDGGSWTDVKLWGKGVGGVPSVAADAYEALEKALTSTGYCPPDRGVSAWAYNCRLIVGSDSMSLHSYGIAVDIDPSQNPFTAGGAHDGWLKEKHVDAVMAIRNTSGKRIWFWAGYWTRPDRMHFQLDVGPGECKVDWSTVAGDEGEDGGDLAHMSKEAQEYWQETYESLKKDPAKPNDGDKNPPGPKLFSYWASVWRYSVKKTGKTGPSDIVGQYLKDTK